MCSGLNCFHSKDKQDKLVVKKKSLTVAEEEVDKVKYLYT